MTTARTLPGAVLSPVRIREVGPRDGFQNEPEIIPTRLKVELINALARTGVPRLEITSFVRADVIPQLADAAEVLRAVEIPEGVRRSVLIPNERGLDDALELRDRFDEINVFLSASETHNRKNVNRSIEERVWSIARRLRDAGAQEIGFGDTTGMANPVQVREFFPAAREALGGEVELTAHFHNTRGQALANVFAAWDAGVDSFESSFGELGGCPVPKGATGNVATEDVVSMLDEMGAPTGIDLAALLECSRRVRRELRRPLGSHTLTAGPIVWND